MSQTFIALFIALSATLPSFAGDIDTLELQFQLKVPTCVETCEQISYVVHGRSIVVNRTVVLDGHAFKSSKSGKLSRNNFTQVLLPWLEKIEKQTPQAEAAFARVFGKFRGKSVVALYDDKSEELRPVVAALGETLTNVPWIYSATKNTYGCHGPNRTSPVYVNLTAPKKLADTEKPTYSEAAYKLLVRNACIPGSLKGPVSYLTAEEQAKLFTLNPSVDRGHSDLTDLSTLANSKLAKVECDCGKFPGEEPHKIFANLDTGAMFSNAPHVLAPDAPEPVEAPPVVVAVAPAPAPKPQVVAPPVVKPSEPPRPVAQVLPAPAPVAPPVVVKVVEAPKPVVKPVPKVVEVPRPAPLPAPIPEEPPKVTSVPIEPPKVDPSKLAPPAPVILPKARPVAKPTVTLKRPTVVARKKISFLKSAKPKKLKRGTYLKLLAPANGTFVDHGKPVTFSFDCAGMKKVTLILRTGEETEAERVVLPENICDGQPYSHLITDARRRTFPVVVKGLTEKKKSLKVELKLKLNGLTKKNHTSLYYTGRCASFRLWFDKTRISKERLRSFTTFSPQTHEAQDTDRMAKQIKRSALDDYARIVGPSFEAEIDRVRSFVNQRDAFSQALEAADQANKFAPIRKLFTQKHMAQACDAALAQGERLFKRGDRAQMDLRQCHFNASARGGAVKVLPGSWRALLEKFQIVEVPLRTDSCSQ